MTGRVFLVGAGPGAPDLITVRGLRVLEAADVILYDALVDPEILNGLRGDTIFVGKRCGNHSLSQEEIIALMVRLARSGKQVVRLKGGDPTVLGRGGEELLALASAGIPFENVPGVTCAVAAPLLAGIPVTHRGLADSFTVVTAHRRGDEQRFSIPPFNPRTTLILLMGVGTVEQWRDQLRAGGYPADLPVAFVTDASTRSQQVLVTTLEWADDQARAHAIRPPTTVIVGKVVSLRSVIASQVPEGKTAAVALEEMLDKSAGANSLF